MSEFTPLRDAVDTLASRSATPAFGELERRATRRGRRRLVTVAAAGALAVIAAGSALAAGTLLGGGERSSLAGVPTASPTPPNDEHLWAPASVERHRALRKTLTSAPGWSITPGGLRGPLTVLDRCSVGWGLGVVASGDNPGPYLPPSGFNVYGDERKYRDAATASAGMEMMLANITSCRGESWRTQPIGQTGAVLAFTDAAVVWIRHENSHVSVLHAATTDGPPPLALQVEVAELMDSWMR